MKKLWAPWRMKYIESFDKVKECVFCKALREDDDEKNLVLYRDTHSFIIMNKYPYNNGHLMIAPNRHVGDITSLSEEEVLSMFRCLKIAISAIRDSMKPDGFNVGINVGRAAGAGIEDHVHMHVLPRWLGDTNFMPVIADTKVISEALEDTYRKLKESIDRKLKESTNR